MITERAKTLRRQIESLAEVLDDEATLEVPELFQNWQVDKIYEVGARAYTSSGSLSTNDWASASGGAVGAVSGATTGNEGNMPPYIIVNRWHRTA